MKPAVLSHAVGKQHESEGLSPRFVGVYVAQQLKVHPLADGSRLRIKICSVAVLLPSKKAQRVESSRCGTSWGAARPRTPTYLLVQKQPSLIVNPGFLLSAAVRMCKTDDMNNVLLV